MFHFGAPKHHTQHMPIFFGKPLGRKEIFHQLRGLQFHGVLHGLSEVAPRGMKAKGLQVHAQRDALLARAGGCVESWMHKVDVNPYLPILFFVFVYVREMGKGEKKTSMYTSIHVCICCRRTHMGPR